MATRTYELIATATGTGSNSVITFSSIPNTYTDLRLMMNLQTVSGGPNNLIVFNGDSGTNYSYRVIGASPSATVYYGSGQGLNYIYNTIGTNLNTFGTSCRTLDIFQYKNTSVYKTVIEVENTNTSTSTVGGTYNLTSTQLWSSTAAITSISMSIAGDTYATTTECRLFGIKAE